MKTKRSLLLASAAIFAGALAAVLVFTIPTKYSRRTQRLPDGSSLKIVSISYGTNHSFAMPHRTPWESFLVNRLPRSWTTRLGLETTGGRIGLSPRPGETSLVIFTLCDHAKPNTLSAISRATLCNEQGTVCDSAFEGAILGGFRGKIQWRVVGWQFSKKLPSDSKFLRLQFSQNSANADADTNTGQQQVAEFFIPNPLLNGPKN